MEVTTGGEREWPEGGGEGYGSLGVFIAFIAFMAFIAFAIILANLQSFIAFIAFLGAIAAEGWNGVMVEHHKIEPQTAMDTWAYYIALQWISFHFVYL